MAYYKRLNEEDIQVDIDNLEVFPEELDFDEFDQVVTKSQITVATNHDHDDEEIELNIDDFDFDEVEKPEEVEDEEIVDVVGVEDEFVEESSKMKKSNKRSIMEMYESRQRKQVNPIVESVLCDKTVDTIANALQSTMRAHGISNAQSFAVLGSILDRMLHASDEDITSEEFVSEVVGDLVDTDDLKSVIANAIEKAISGEDVNLGEIEKEVGEEPVTPNQDVTDEE